MLCTLQLTASFHLVYGPAIIEHCLLCVGLSPGAKLKDLDLNDQLPSFNKAFEIAETIIDEAYSKNLKVRKYKVFIKTIE